MFGGVKESNLVKKNFLYPFFRKIWYDYEKQITIDSFSREVHMRKKRYFQKLYQYDVENRRYLIEVSLDNYDDVYDDWDPSPFKKRDIESEFNDFIVNSSEDIPLKYTICIVLVLPENKKDKKKEAALVSAYQNYYEYIIARIRKNRTSLGRKTLSYFSLSILFLSFGYFYFGSKVNIFINVVKEGIFIGGWVFLWEVFTNLFITGREIRNELKLYQRLLDSEIKFEYI